MLRSATAQMEPPLPPSPPSGPPKGRNFSRQNEAQPLPPSPAITSILASSINFIFCAAIKLKRLYRGQSLSIEGSRLTNVRRLAARSTYYLNDYLSGDSHFVRDHGDELL